MPAGRRAQPDLVKALKGNPGKRKLTPAAVAGPSLAKVTIATPEFLTDAREKTIFTRIIEDYLPRRIARPADITAYGRWASYVHRWMTCKEQLDGKVSWYKVVSNHGERLARHPIFKDMLDLERVMQALEDRLGLNPVARQNIVHGLSTMPAALGGLFGDEPAADPAVPGEQPPAPQEQIPSPIGIGRTH